MLDENIDNVNSENLTENTPTNTEANNPETLGENADKNTQEGIVTPDTTEVSSNTDAKIDKTDNSESLGENTDKSTLQEEVTPDAAEVSIDTDVKVDKTNNPETSVENADKNTKEKEVTPEVTEVPSDKKVEVEKPKIVDYKGLDLEALVAEFQKLLKQEAIPNIKDDIEKIKLNFNQQFGALLKEKKEAFIADGGNEIDFHYSNPIKSTYNDLLFEYKTKRERYYKQLEEEQKENLSKRLALIEDLKLLIDNAEPATMYNQFKELQDKWRVIGKIPRAKYNDTWRTYHHHVERFYDLLHLSNDFRDLDFKHNLEEKLKLVEKAEELAESDDLDKAFKELQVLHRLWKEDIGPVAREHREEIWERFSNATKKIHGKRHEFQKDLDSRYEENVIKKREVIERISNLIPEKTVDSHKFWQQKIRELEALRQEFFNIGRVPRNVNEKVWSEFKDATRNFNRIKNSFYKNIKKEQLDNLQKKNELVEKAESLKDSEDWDVTTEVMKQIQAEWKTIGHVPRKYSDKIWKRFKDACNYYFDRLHNVQDEANKGQVEAFEKKKELLENLKSQASNEQLTLEVVNSYVDDWHKLGGLPSNMRHIETKFNKTLNSLYGKLNLDEKEIALLKFKNIIGNYLDSNNTRKIDNEQLFVRKKIDEITREIQQLENNIGFISNAGDDNPLLKNVRDNIDNYNKQLEIWKTKLNYLTNLEY